MTRLKDLLSLGTTLLRPTVNVELSFVKAILRYTQEQDRFNAEMIKELKIARELLKNMEMRLSGIEDSKAPTKLGEISKTRNN